MLSPAKNTGSRSTSFEYTVYLGCKNYKGGIPMDDNATLDFKPRARGMVIGDIPWLARITDKARAKLEGRIGDYIYPCPADARFLQDVQLEEAEFTEMVRSCDTDDEVIEKMKAHLAAKQAG